MVMSLAQVTFVRKRGAGIWIGTPGSGIFDVGCDVSPSNGTLYIHPNFTPSSRGIVHVDL